MGKRLLEQRPRLKGRLTRLLRNTTILPRGHGGGKALKPLKEKTIASKAPFALALAILLSPAAVQAKSATEVFELASPSVVVVKSRDAGGQKRSLGSGVILDDGVVVTNCHVVQEADSIKVFYRESKYPAALLYTDWERDVCSLAVPGLKGQAARKGETSHVKVGEKVYAIGAPKGLELTLSDGIISGLRQMPSGQYLQTTAPISPGSSGGGLFDEEGRLIGLSTFYVSEGQQLNFAVPVEWINELPHKNRPVPKAQEESGSEFSTKASALLKNKDWPALLDHGRRYTRINPGAVEGWAVLSLAYLGTGQQAKAIAASQQALRINQKLPYLWTGLGSAYLAAGQLGQAIGAYQKAIRLDPKNVPAWHALGVAYAKANRAGQALEVYKRLQTLDPEVAKDFYQKFIARRV